MNVLKNFAAGLGRVLKSPALILWIYFASVLIALPVSLAVKNILHESFGMSLVNENMRAGFDLSWFGEFSAGSSGLASTFGPWVTGIVPVLSNLESLLDGKLLRGGTLLLAGGAFLLLWTFFAGGILDRYANPGAPRLRVRFFAHCGDNFFSFLRLLAISLALYYAVFRFAANPLHSWVENSTRDVTTERTVIFYTAAVYALTALLLAFFTLVFDYARIAIVVEHRRSALFAFLRGLRFVFSNPVRTCGLYLLLTATGLVLFGTYGYAAPGPGQATWRAVVGAFLLGQAFILCRIVLKLWFLSSQTLLFQSAQSAAAPAQAMPGPTVL
ncbi:MAG: hypothetical protein HY234_03270 [Acidobacteria bacterium]|nr:hypothetical protein [Acidobacteriota bacterium]